MARYLISDHHFGHSNIIRYCDRPFSSAGEMDATMLNRYYETITAEDVLIHLGDVAMDMQDGQETIERFEKLNGNLLVRGNHDVGLEPANAPFPVVESCVLEHDEYTFYLTHRPEDIPDEWDGWAIHGHIHNNDVENYPFIAADQRRVNVSAELLDYRPISMAQLVTLLDECGPTARISDMDAAATLGE